MASRLQGRTPPSGRYWTLTWCGCAECRCCAERGRRRSTCTECRSAATTTEVECATSSGWCRGSTKVESCRASGVCLSHRQGHAQGRAAHPWLRLESARRASRSIPPACGALEATWTLAEVAARGALGQDEISLRRLERGCVFFRLQIPLAGRHLCRGGERDRKFFHDMTPQCPPSALETAHTHI